MKLYEINVQLMQLVDDLDFDPETGEIGETTEETMDKIDALQIEKNEILQYLAECELNLRADAEALKAEEKRLHDRRDRIGKRADRLISVLDRECGGVKRDLGVATLCYRQTSSLAVDDPDAAYHFLRDFNYKKCYSIPAPEIRKDEVKKLLKDGVEVPGTRIVNGVSINLK